MIKKYSIKTDERLVEISKNLIGWYWDTNCSLSLVVKEFLITIFVNSDTNEIDITVDTINPNTGFFEQNLEWETPVQNTKEIINCACNFVKKYGIN